MKKLIEILYDAGFKWPEGDWACVAQDEDGRVFAYGNTPEFYGCIWCGWDGRKAQRVHSSQERASDWDTSVITREEYERYCEMRADGWIPLSECVRQVERDVLVDVLYVDGTNTIGRPADEFDWSGGDILAYRLHAGPAFKFCDYSQNVFTRDAPEYDGLHSDTIADGDGWIPWNGGKQPVTGGTRVDVTFRDRSVNSIGCPAEEFIWGDGDIIAYRLHVEPGVYIAPNTPPAPQVPSYHTVYHEGEVYRNCEILLQTAQLTAWRCDGQEYAVRAHQAMIDPDDDQVAAALMSGITGHEIAPEHITELRAQMGWNG